MVEVKFLEARNSCQRKAYFLEANLESAKNYNYFTSILLKKLIQDKNFTNLTMVEVEKAYDEMVPQDLFTNIMEYNEQKSLFSQRFINMITHFNTMNLKVEKSNIYGETVINGVTIKVKNLVLLSDGKNHYLTQIKGSKMTLTLRGRKEDTLPGYSIDLAAIQSFINENYPDKNYTPTLVCLKSRKGNSTTVTFEEKATENMISYTISDEQLVLVGEKIKNLNDLTINNESPQTITSNCDICPFLKMCQKTVVPTLKKKPKKDNIKKFDISLTQNQTDLIFSEKGIIRANAGAGAGKTTVIALRYLNLISTTNVKSKDMLLITYTRKGAEEMKSRILSLQAEFDLDKELKEKDLKVMTFHEFCQMFISKNKKDFGYKEDVYIGSIAENMSLANEVILTTEKKVSFFRYNNPKMNLFTAKGALYQLLEWMEWIRDMKNRHQDYSYIQETYNGDREISSEDQEVLEHYFETFEQKRKEKGIMQYDVLLSEMMNVLKSNVKKLNKRLLTYKHIMIDEAQDCDDYQFEIVVELIQIIKDQLESLLLIGDDGQSIFGFRNASANNFIYLDVLFGEEVKDIHLSENFRSTKQIVELGNRINQMNENKVEKSSVAVNNSTPYKPTFSYVPTRKEELNLIVENVKKDIKSGIKLSEIAVIARKNKDLFEIQELLKEAKVPSIVITPIKLIERSSLQSFISLAKVLTSLPEERMSKEVYEAYNLFLPPATTSAQLELFSKQLLTRIETEYDNRTEEEKDLFVENYFNELLKKDFTLEALKDKAKNYSREELLSYLLDISQYEDDISFSIDESKFDGVVLTTIHTSKGKEFFSVHHTISSYTSKSKNDDEERNLLFVAVTRAKERLNIYLNNETKRPFISNVVHDLSQTDLLRTVNML